MSGLPAAFELQIAEATGRRPRSVSALGGGCIADVFRIDLDGGERCVAKIAEDGDLTLEAKMLTYLAEQSGLPVPEVLLATNDLLLMDYIDTAGQIDTSAEEHAAELLAGLHQRTATAYGFHYDTLIGPLAQPNPWCDDWIDFFREQRLLHMGKVALDRGRLPAPLFRDLERLCGKLDRYLAPASKPGLIHGDLWTGNVLVKGGRIVGFVDPAIYYADPEVELAFSTLFGTFGDSFFRHYQARRPLEPGFFEVRRDLYNLYPLLVHTALFGGSYAASVAAVLRRY